MKSKKALVEIKESSCGNQRKLLWKSKKAIVAIKISRMPVEIWAQE